jgi:hypothetical protein
MIKGSGVFSNPEKKGGALTPEQIQQVNDDRWRAKLKARARTVAQSGGSLDSVMPDISVLKAKLSGDALNSVATAILNASANYYANQTGPEKDAWVKRFKTYTTIPSAQNAADGILPKLSNLQSVLSGQQLQSIAKLLADNAQKTLDFHNSPDTEPLLGSIEQQVQQRLKDYQKILS